MKITVINGTEKKGVTYRLKEILLEQFRDSAEITEFYLVFASPAYVFHTTGAMKAMLDHFGYR